MAPAVGRRWSALSRRAAQSGEPLDHLRVPKRLGLKGLKIGAGYHYFGSTPVDDVVNSSLSLAADPLLWHRRLDGRVQLQLRRLKMTAQLNVTNLFDRTYYTARLPMLTCWPLGFQAGAYFRSYGAPFSVLARCAPSSTRARRLPLVAAGPDSLALAARFTWTGLYVGGQMGYGWGDNYGRSALGDISYTAYLVRLLARGSDGRNSRWRRARRDRRRPSRL